MIRITADEQKEQRLRARPRSSQNDELGAASESGSEDEASEGEAPEGAVNTDVSPAAAPRASAPLAETAPVGAHAALHVPPPLFAEATGAAAVLQPQLSNAHEPSIPQPLQHEAAATQLGVMPMLPPPQPLGLHMLPQRSQARVDSLSQAAMASDPSTSLSTRPPSASVAEMPVDMPAANTATRAAGAADNMVATRRNVPLLHAATPPAKRPAPDT